MNTSNQPNACVLSQGYILCGDDFSENAVRAASVAGALAKKLSVRLVLTHVCERSSNDFAAMYDWARYFDGAQHCLRSDTIRLAEEGVEVNEELPVGMPAAKGILKMIDERRPSLVVLSSVSKATWSRWTLGSVADEVIKLSWVPTLIIRDPVPLQRWIKGDRPLKVFIAFDFSDASATALRWATQLQRIGPCHFTLGYVDWPPAEANRLDGIPLNDQPQIAELRWKIEHDLKQKVEHLGGPAIDKFVIDMIAGRADYPLVNMAVSEEADVVVVGSHQRHGVERFWHTSISRAVVSHAPVNVIVVPIAEAAMVTPVSTSSPHIMVTTDLTAVGNKAVKHAFATAPQGGIVKLLHVISPNEPASADQKQTEMGTINLPQERADQLRELVPSDAVDHGIKTEVTVLEDSDPASAICREAERFGADVICLASHQRSKLAQTMIGSVAGEVIRRTNRPVLVVPGKEN
jgi:nucleotide-binding universal stress UspA family protein